MSLFFDNIHTIDQFTHELDTHHDCLECSHCFKYDQFVPHGFVYKNQHLNNCNDNNDDKEAVGKRLLCSNRYGRSGCGHTLRLYLADCVPALSRTAKQITLFFISLITGHSIQQAYQRATHTLDPRNAYRWLGKCQAKLLEYRTLLTTPAVPLANLFKARVRRLQLLLPAMARLQNKLHPPFVTHYQLKSQRCFV